MFGGVYFGETYFGGAIPPPVEAPVVFAYGASAPTIYSAGASVSAAYAYAAAQPSTYAYGEAVQ